MALTKAKGSSFASERYVGVSVMDYGATGDGITNDTAAFQAAIDSTTDAKIAAILVPSGSYAGAGITSLTTGTRTIVWREQGDVLYPNGAPPGNREFTRYSGDESRPWNYGEWGFIQDGTTGVASTESPTLRVDKRTDHTGGTTGGTEFSAVNIIDTVSSTVENYETALIAVLDNAGGGVTGQNLVGLHVECRKAANGAGAHFGANIACIDETGNASATSLGSMLGLELTMSCGGADDANTRFGMDVVLKKETGHVATSYYAGIRIRPSDATNRETTIKNGIILQDGTSGGLTTGIYINSESTAGEHIKIEAKSNTGRIRLGSDRSANGDIISELFFQANDSAAAETDYALTRGVILDNTATAETARVDHRVMAAGTMTTAMALTGDLTNAVSLLVDGTLSTVTAGAPDSGGAGYRYLRIVN